MLIIGIVLALLGGILIYWNISYSPQKAHFNKEMMSRVNKIESEAEMCTSEELERLPQQLREYCKQMGVENTTKYQAVRTLFKDTDFVFNQQAGTVIKMDYDLWLLYNEPFRCAYCTSSMYGIPFDGVDYCTEHQEGGMKGFLGKALQLFDTCDAQGYKAGLISWLAETIALNPAALVSPYIEYEVIDALHIKATVNYNGVSGSGIITFNEEGLIIEFYSDERQVEWIDGRATHIGWRCDYENYIEKAGRKQISSLQAVKIFPDKEVVYFASDNFTVSYLK